MTRYFLPIVSLISFLSALALLGGWVTDGNSRGLIAAAIMLVLFIITFPRSSEGDS